MEACGLFPTNKKLSFLFISILLQQEEYIEAMEEIEHALLTFGIDDEILSAAVTVREHIGPLIIKETSRKIGTLSVCMIAKDEEKYMARCLASLKPVADEIIVVDTGSTDRTKNIARAFGAQIFDFPWTNDFSEARNFSLEKAKGHWILVHDADEVISSRDCDKLKDIIGQKTSQLAAYSLTARNYTKNPNLENFTVNNGEYPDEEEGPGWCPTTKVRLFRNNSKIRFQNQVHELLEPSLERAGIKTRHSTIPIHHYGKLDQERSLSRAEMYFELGKTKILSFQHTGALRELAIQAGELKKYSQALGLWDMYIRFKPGDDVAYFNMATLYLEICEFEKALEAAKIARKTNPQSRDVLLSFATSSMCAGDITEATDTLETLQKREPAFVTASSALAAAYCICAREEESIELLKGLWAKQYDPRPSFYWLSTRLMKAGRSQYAAAVLEGLLKWDTANKDILALLEDCRATQNRAVV
jgi:glycosyltransferase involved in cell wall biosynthesis